MTPSFIVDDMDNHKSHIPRTTEIGKTSGSLFRLPTKVTGCIIWSGKYPQDRKVVFLVNHNQFEQRKVSKIKIDLNLRTVFVIQGLV